MEPIVSAGRPARQTAARDVHNRVVPRKRRKKDDRLEPYRQVRKPVPPPERVDEDRRRKLEEEEAEREIREGE